MLNRRILRIKAFKVLYGSAFSDNMQLTRAEAELDMSCEAARDLYVFMTGVVSPLTQIAREKIDALKRKTLSLIPNLLKTDLLQSLIMMWIFRRSSRRRSIRGRSMMSF